MGGHFFTGGYFCIQGGVLCVSVELYLSVHQLHLFHKFIKCHAILEPLFDKLGVVLTVEFIQFNQLAPKLWIFYR